MVEAKEILDHQKLEELLVSRWSDFLEVRKLLDFARNIATEVLDSGERIQHIQKISISRFEPASNGFLIWIEYIVNLSNPAESVNMTSEVFLDLSGDIRHVDSI